MLLEALLNPSILCSLYPHDYDVHAPACFGIVLSLFASFTNLSLRIVMSHREMIAQKTVQLTMTEIKELNFQLDQSMQRIRQQLEQAREASEESVLREKAEFIEQIVNKLNG